MKRGVIVVLAAVLLAVIAAAFWQGTRPHVSATAKQDCAPDKEDYANCIAREQQVEQCVEKNGDALQACLKNASLPGEFTEPSVRIQTGPLPS